MKLKPLHDNVLVTEMNFGNRTLSSGIIMLADDSKSSGIRPRWAKVFAIGPDQKDVEVGQWVLVDHGRWTRGVKIDLNGEKIVLRRIDTNAILLVSDAEPNADDLLADDKVI
jgi:co-chaperonin GroES (HSP10)